jgi:hypothetical protein
MDCLRVAAAVVARDAVLERVGLHRVWRKAELDVGLQRMTTGGLACAVGVCFSAGALLDMLLS